MRSSFEGDKPCDTSFETPYTTLLCG